VYLLSVFAIWKINSLSLSLPEQKHETLRESAEVVVPIDRRKLIQVDCAEHLYDVTGSRGQDGGVRRKTRKRQTNYNKLLR